MLGDFVNLKNFHLNSPVLLIQKMEWNFKMFVRASESGEGSGASAFHTATYAAFDFVISAWHMTDWVYKTHPVAQAEYKSLEAFQAAIRKDCFALKVCDQMANSAKHFGKDKYPMTGLKPEVVWNKEFMVIVGEPESAREIGVWPSFYIYRDGEELKALDVFREALNYWRESAGFAPVDIELTE